MGEWRKQVRGYLTQAVTLGEIRQPTAPREHAIVAETLLTMMDGMQVRAVLLPSQQTPQMMWKMIDGLLQPLLVRSPSGHTKRAR